MKQFKSPSKTMIRKFTPSTLYALLAFSSIATDQCAAITYSNWTGPNNGDWSIAGNWIGGVPDGLDEGAIFGGIGGSPAVLTADITINQIQFAGYGITTLTGKRFFTVNDSLSVPPIFVVNQYTTNTVSCPITMTNSLFVNALSGTELTLSGIIDGAQIIKSGPGKLVLSGVNTYTGGTRIDLGTVSISADNNLGLSTTGILFPSGVGTLQMNANIPTSTRLIDLTVPGALFVDSGFTANFSGQIIGTRLDVTGPGTLVLSNISVGSPNNYSTGTQITGGGVVSISQDNQLGTGGVTFASTGGALEYTLSMSSSKQISVNAPAILEVDAGATVTLTGQITGVSTLGMTGLGKLILANPSFTNNYSGGISILSGGTLSINNSSQLGNPAGSVTFSTVPGGILEFTTSPMSISNPINLNVAGVVSPLAVTQLAGTIGGTGSLTVLGTQSLLITGTANTYQGGTIIGNATTAAAPLVINNEGSLGNSSGPLTFSSPFGGTLTIAGTLGSSRTFQLNGPAILQTTFPATIGGKITGGSSVTLNGGDFTFSNTSVGTPNDYAGGTYFNNVSSLTISQDNQLGATAGPVVFNDPNSTLTFNGNIPTSTRPFTLDTNTSFRVLSNNTVNLSGNIGGTGSLVVNGPGFGKLVLGGINTYSGGTRITGGSCILSVAADQNLGTGPITFITSGGILEITQNGFSSAKPISFVLPGTISVPTLGNTATLSGLISGGSRFTKDEFGTLVLTNSTNTFSGGLLMLLGTVSVADDGMLGDPSGSISMQSNSTLLITQDGFISNRNLDLLSQGVLSVGAGDTATWSGLISGNSNVSRLTKAGLGTVILEGINTYQGGTVIAGGKLQISRDENLGDPSGSVTFGPAGELDILGDMTTARSMVLSSGTEAVFVAPNRTVTFSGTVSGGSNFTKLGSGTLILTGPNTYTGPTLISSGVIQGTTNSIPGNVVNNSSATEGFILDQNFDGTFDGDITGSGVFAKRGSGVVTLTGTSNFGGETQLEEGTLLVNGTLACSDVVVSLGAILGGSGSVSGGLDIYGTLSPGNSIGTFTVSSGDYVAHPGSTLVNEINPTMTDLVDVTAGDVVIDSGATISILFDSGVYSFPTTYTLAQASGIVSGEFDTVLSNFPAHRFSLLYNAQNIQLLLTGIFYSELVTHGNASAVAHCADKSTAPLGSDFANVINSLQGHTADYIYSAFNQMQPSAFKGLIVSQQNIMLEVENSLNARYLAYHPTPCNETHQAKRALWMETFASDQVQDKKHVHQSPAPGYATRAYGILAGVDTPFGDGFLIGAMTGYTRGNLSFHENAGHGETQTAYLGPYAGFNRSHYYINASILGQANWYETNRKIEFAGRTAHSSHEGQGALVHLGGGGWVTYSKVDISPFVNFDYIFMAEDAYAETGANSLNLRVDSSVYQYTEVELGFMVRTCAKITHGTLIPEIRLSVIAENRYQGDDYRASLPDTQECSFVVEGYYPNRILFAPELKLSSQLYNDRLTAAIYFQGKYGDGFKQNELGINLAWTF